MGKLLSAKQKLFCQGVARGLTQEQAWIAAGYSKKAARSCASRAMEDDDICKHIDKLMKPAETAIRLNSELVHERLYHIALMGDQEQTTADSLRAIAEYNKLVGAYQPDKIQINPIQDILDDIRSGR